MISHEKVRLYRFVLLELLPGPLVRSFVTHFQQECIFTMNLMPLNASRIVLK